MSEKQDLVRPSGQSFSLDTGLAAAYGIKEAFLIQHFQHWIRVNKTRNKNFRDGKTWTYQTYNEIADHFPFLTSKMVRTAIDNLINYGVLVKGSYNKMAGDNTCWFAFSDESIYVPELNKNKVKDEYPQESSPLESESPPLPKRAEVCPNGQRSAQTGRAIPDTKPDIRNKDQPTPKDENLVGGLHKESKKIDIYPCLREIDIQDKDKIRLTSQFDEVTVSKAVAHCTKKGFKIQSSLDSSIFYFCKNPSHITLTKEEIQAQKLKEQEENNAKIENRKEAAQYLIKKFWTKCREIGVRLYSGNGYLEVSNDRIQEKIYYIENKFAYLLSHLLKKVGLEVPNFLETLA